MEFLQVHYREIWHTILTSLLPFLKIAPYVKLKCNRHTFYHDLMPSYVAINGCPKLVVNMDTSRIARYYSNNVIETTR